MVEYLIPNSNVKLFYGNSNNGKLIISSHGGVSWQDKLLDKIPFNLHFMAYVNRTTKGVITSVASMTTDDFMNEPMGTSGIKDHYLTYYGQDTHDEILQCVEDQHYDVVTINQHSRVTLSSVIDLLKGYHRYTDVYCLFCRVAIGQTHVSIVSNDVHNELQRSFQSRGKK